MNSMQYLVTARKARIWNFKGDGDHGFRFSDHAAQRRAAVWGIFQYCDGRTLSVGTKSVILFYDTCIFVSASKIRYSDCADSDHDPGEPGNLCSGSGDFRTVCAERTGGRCDTGVDRRKTHDTCL